MLRLEKFIHRKDWQASHAQRPVKEKRLLFLEVHLISRCIKRLKMHKQKTGNPFLTVTGAREYAELSDTRKCL